MAYKTRREIISERVRAALADRAITQQSLSRSTGIPERTLARRLAGKSTWTIDELDAVSASLDVSMARLIGAEAA